MTVTPLKTEDTRCPIHDRPRAWCACNEPTETKPEQPAPTGEEMRPDDFRDHALYAVPIVAAFLGLDEQTFRGIEQSGFIRRAPNVGQRVLFTGREVKRYAASLQQEDDR